MIAQSSWKRGMLVAGAHLVGRTLQPFGGLAQFDAQTRDILLVLGGRGAKLPLEFGHSSVPSLDFEAQLVHLSMFNKIKSPHLK